MKAVIFDADDTLVDYKSDATRAFHAALQAVECDTPAAFSACLTFDYGNWDKVGLSDVHLPAVQSNYHTLYRGHVSAIFRHVDETVGLNGRADEAERAFLAAFSEAGTPVEGAVETVAALKKKYRVYAATNGLGELQHSRLAAFGLSGIFVSEDIGAIKPSPAFFGHILERLGAAPGELTMVGDSLASDIAGAAAAGIPCIWFNRRGAPVPAGVRAIGRLSDLLEIL